MGKRLPWDYVQWQSEVNYICRVDPENPGSTFSNDPECFRSYCEMMEKHCREDGYERFADMIDAHIKDAANA